MGVLPQTVAHRVIHSVNYSLNPSSTFLWHSIAHLFYTTTATASQLFASFAAAAAKTRISSVSHVAAHTQKYMKVYLCVCLCVWQVTQSCMWLAPLSILTTLMCFLLSFVASCWLLSPRSISLSPLPCDSFAFPHYAIVVVVAAASVVECSSGALLRHLQHSFTWQYFVKIATAFSAAAIITTTIMKRKHTQARTHCCDFHIQMQISQWKKVCRKARRTCGNFLIFAYFLIVVVLFALSSDVYDNSSESPKRIIIRKSKVKRKAKWAEKEGCAHFRNRGSYFETKKYFFIGEIS